MGKKSFWLIFLGSLFIRLIVSDQSFWLDEGSSLVLAGLPLGGLFEALKGDFHPPLFYILLHFWLPLAGRSEWIIRLPSLIFGALTVPVLYLFLAELFGREKRKIALFAALLLTINPFHLYYSAELRMYSLNGLLSTLSWLLLLTSLKDKTNSRRSWGLFTLVSLANIYTFYGALFNLASQWVFILWQHKNKFKPFIICNLIIGILFLPWVPTLSQQLTGGGYINTVLPGWSLISGNLSPKSLGLIMAKFTLGRISLANKSAYALFVFGISFYFLLTACLCFLKKEKRPLLIWFFASILAAIVVSLKAPVLGYWRYVFLLPAFLSILVAGLSALPRSAYYFNLSLIALIFIFSNLIFANSPQFQREDWRSAAKVIRQDKAISIVNFPDTFAPLKFYAPDVYYYPDQISLGKMRPDLDQSLPLVLKGKETVFVFDYLSDLSDRKRFILTWLKRAGYNQQPTHNINGVGFIYEFKAP